MAYKKKDKISLLLYYDYIEQFELLDDSQLRKLVYAMIEYDKTGNEPKLDKMTKMAFVPIKRRLVEDKKKWEETCKTNSENAKKRWEKNANVCDGMQMHAKYADIDKDKEIEKEKEIEKDIEVGIYNLPPTTAEILNFSISNFKNYSEKDLKKSCKKFFDYFEKNGWDKINWKEKIIEWLEKDVEYGKLKKEESLDDRAKRLFGDN